MSPPSDGLTRQASVSRRWNRTMTSSTQANFNQLASSGPFPARPIADYRPPARLLPELEARSVVDYSPSEIVRRHSVAWSGLRVETVQVMRHKPFEYGFRPPYHLLLSPTPPTPS